MRAIELVDAAIANIDRLDGAPNAVVTRTFELARSDAIGSLPAGPLSGVPFLVKDFGPVASTMDRIGRTQGSGEHLKNVQELQKISRAVGHFFRDVDVLLTPTVGVPHSRSVLRVGDRGGTINFGAWRSRRWRTPLASRPCPSPCARPPRAFLSACSSLRASATRPPCSASPANSRGPVPGHTGALRCGQAPSLPDRPMAQIALSDLERNASDDRARSGTTRPRRRAHRFRRCRSSGQVRRVPVRERARFSG